MSKFAMTLMQFVEEQNNLDLLTPTEIFEIISDYIEYLEEVRASHPQ